VDMFLLIFIFFIPSQKHTLPHPPKKKKKKKKKPTTQKKKKRRRERASLTYYILRNQTYMSPQIIQPDVFDVMVINKYTACLRCKEQICTLD
jgi:hypothetical protein